MTKINYDYVRVSITGELQTLTPLHIGDGGFGEPNSRRESKQQVQDNEQPLEWVATLCLNKDGKPYLPASAIKGLLRSKAPKILQDGLMGSPNTEKTEPSENQPANYLASRLRVYDAHWKDNATAPYQSLQQTRIRIDPVLGVAAQGALFGSNLVPKDERFSFSAELDFVSESELEEFLSLLAIFNGNLDGRLGANEKHSQGQLKWVESSIAIKTVAKADVTKWLLGDSAKLLDSGQVYSTTRITETNYQSQKTIIPFQIQTLSPLLCIDREWGDDATGAPDLSWVRQRNPLANPTGKLNKNGVGDIAIIPASTLLGWFRARCRKILMTWLLNEGNGQNLSLNEQNARVDKELHTLFGSEQQAGLIGFSDAHSINPISEEQIHQQTFNAIDRFTGGVSKGALYTVEALEAVTLAGKIIVRRPKTFNENPWRGLLFLSLRDASTDDLWLGWGKAKGFGECRLTLLISEEGHQKNWIETLGAIFGHDYLMETLNDLKVKKEAFLATATSVETNLAPDKPLSKEELAEQKKRERNRAKRLEKRNKKGQK